VACEADGVAEFLGGCFEVWGGAGVGWQIDAGLVASVERVVGPVNCRRCIRPSETLAAVLVSSRRWSTFAVHSDR
jgi:hypothetical protein